MKKAYKRFAILTISAALAGVVALGACSLGGQTGGDDTDPDDPTIDNNDPTPEPEEKYSQILNDVLESDYYAELTDMYRGISFQISKAHEAIPYAFLSREGFDIQAIKDEEIDCDSVAYIKNDDTSTLYLSTKVVTDGADPYYTCYTLSYPLTDKEYDDLAMLHQEKYIQAPYFIQELDNQKTAKVISKASITVEAYDGILNYLVGFAQMTSAFGTDKLDLDFIDFSVDNQTFEVNLRTTPNRGNNTSTMVMIVPNAELRNIILLPSNLNSVITLRNNSSVFAGPFNYFDTLINNQNEYDTNYDSLTYFDSSAMRNLHLGSDL